MNDRLTFAVILVLGAGFLAGIAGGFILAFHGIAIPGELIASTASAGGALAALLVRPPGQAAASTTSRNRDRSTAT